MRCTFRTAHKPSRTCRSSCCSKSYRRRRSRTPRAPEGKVNRHRPPMRRRPTSSYPRLSGVCRSSRRVRRRRARETPSPGDASWHRFHSDPSASARISRRCYPNSTARADTGSAGRCRRTLGHTTRNARGRSMCQRRRRRIAGAPSCSGRGRCRRCIRACRSGSRDIGSRSYRNFPRCPEAEYTLPSTGLPRRCT
jgi:hypothetical protein